MFKGEARASAPSGGLMVRLDGFSGVSLSNACARPGAKLRRPGAGLGAAALAVAALVPSLAMAQAPATLGGSNKPFTIGAQVITGYETNPARGNGVNAAVRHINGDEVTVSPSITAVYSRSVGQLGLALSGNFGYDYHTKNDTLNSEHLDFSIIGNKAVGAFCSVGGDGDYNRSQSDLQYLTVNVTKNVQQTYRIGGSESCTSGAGLTESLHVYRASTQNSSSALVGYDVTGVSGMLGYSNHAIGTVGVTLSYDKTDYGRVPTSLISPKSLDVESIGLQISRPIGARLSGQASVSYSHSSQDLSLLGLFNVGSSSFNGLTYSAGLNYIVGPRLQLSTNFSRQVSASILAGTGYSVVDSAGLSANYTVSSRISANLGATWSKTDYHGVDPLLALTTPTWQQQTTVYGRISTSIGRRAAASLDLRHQIGRSSLALYDYTSDYVGLTLSTSF
ncbi:MAG: outer membrane beta-barrel protein [Caulobacteraceae bacterium]